MLYIFLAPNLQPNPSYLAFYTTPARKIDPYTHSTTGGNSHASSSGHVTGLPLGHIHERRQRRPRSRSPQAKLKGIHQFKSNLARDRIFDRGDRTGRVFAKPYCFVSEGDINCCAPCISALVVKREGRYLSVSLPQSLKITV